MPVRKDYKFAHGIYLLVSFLIYSLLFNIVESIFPELHSFTDMLLSLHAELVLKEVK